MFLIWGRCLFCFQTTCVQHDVKGRLKTGLGIKFHPSR
ncbi:hypothetical protein HMPREF1051_2354 [Neisseria sicca VK64]|uniref:Uncharacterized protein n=1 Tax=Neisseria sicca VK64 TaxID=1095748 RepID=I2NC28_NEISI|nr:hypothetical protein HMPREF1051_2354 [Neisseria sicca VK64]